MKKRNIIPFSDQLVQVTYTTPSRVCCTGMGWNFVKKDSEARKNTSPMPEDTNKGA